MERSRGERVNSTISPTRCAVDQMMQATNAHSLVTARNADDSIIYLLSKHAWRYCSDVLCIVAARKISLDSFGDAWNHLGDIDRPRHNVAERPFPIPDEDEERRQTDSPQSDRKSCVRVCLWLSCWRSTTWFTASFSLREGDLRMKSALKQSVQKTKEKVKARERGRESEGAKGEREHQKKAREKNRYGINCIYASDDQSLYSVLKVCSTSSDIDKYRTNDLRCCTGSPHACYASFACEDKGKGKLLKWNN